MKIVEDLCRLQKKPQQVIAKKKNNLNNEGPKNNKFYFPVSIPESTRTTFPFFRRRFGYTSTTRRPKTTEPSSAGDKHYYDEKQLSDSDQNISPSIQENKFTNSRFNQIGENLNDGIVEAITTISKAPLPVLITSTAKYSNGNFFNSTSDNNGFSESLNSKQITRKMDIIPTSKNFFFFFNLL